MSIILEVARNLEARLSSDNSKVLHTSPHLHPRDPTDPANLHVVHDPGTGSKRPYELWGSLTSGHKYRLRSFGSEKAAKANMDKSATAILSVRKHQGVIS
jgi:hypothetical protein